MADFEITSTGSIDAEDIIQQATNMKELLNLEFVSDADNILLNKYIIKLLYGKLLEIESRFNGLGV